MDTFRRNQSADTIRLDADGNWFQGEYPILHERTSSYLHKHIERDEDGNYFLTGEEKPVYIEVEDVPYWICKLERTIAGYLITLTDESIELLDPESLWVGEKEGLYCLVKGGGVPAKFQRNTFHELAKYMESKGASYVLSVGSKKYPISKTAPTSLMPKIAFDPKKNRGHRKARPVTVKKPVKKVAAAQVSKPVQKTSKKPVKKVEKKKSLPKKPSKKSAPKKIQKPKAKSKKK